MEARVAHDGQHGSRPRWARCRPGEQVTMGRAILHVHTTFSDGTATVDEIMDVLDRDGMADVVGFTDHDDARAFDAALAWVRCHPASSVRPIWGVELTIRAFKHLCLYKLTPPFPAAPPRKFLSLSGAVGWAKAAGALVVVPHVNTPWIGLGGDRIERHAARLGIDGFELFNPYHGAARDLARLAAMNERYARRHGRALLALGGSDAHHIEDLYRVIVDFPGRSPADLERALATDTAVPRWGPPRPAPPMRQRLKQHTRALIIHPTEQVRTWAGRRLRAGD
jgi:predicted metal-dependent phosphoesterase TrpH